MFIFIQVVVVLYDDANPNQKVTTELVFPIRRNEYGPKFDSVLYSEEVSENFPLGEVILKVTATDRDEVCFILRVFFRLS